MFPIDPRDTRAIYEQIIDNIKEQVIKGVLKPGDQLPSVRQLASMLTVNANTVMKAYGELERQEVIETVRGKGAFISMAPSKNISEKSHAPAWLFSIAIILCHSHDKIHPLRFLIYFLNPYANSPAHM